MKAINILILLLFTANNFTIKAQGIYRNASDFKQRYYWIKSNTNEKFKVYPHKHFHTNEIKVVCGDSIFNIAKADIYGYTDKEGNQYRFFNNQQYKIINPTENVLLYSKQILAGPKGNTPTLIYFFSKDADSPISELSILNVKNTFRENTQLIEKFDLHFKNDLDLIQYDAYYKTYKINHLINTSK
jgi:hypothetical protein